MALKRQPGHKTDSVRNSYEQLGVRGFYERCGDEYRNPHEPAIRALLRRALPAWELDLRKVLDLACGSGEITLALRELGASDIDGIDPFTGAAYLQRTGAQAEPYTFEQIAGGVLIGRAYSLIVCSFALHLVEESRLPALATQLALIAETLVVITPHKRPQLKPAWGWNCADEMLVERVRARLHKRI